MYARALGWGLGVDAEPAKAFELAQKSASQNFPPGLNLLGCLYLDGVGIDADLFKAAKLFKQAAALGNVKAKRNLGNCYLKGDGVPMDAVKAVNLLQEAALEGSADAANDLGYYFLKHEIKDRQAQAFRWYSMAADLGSDCGKADLAMCYRVGIGCETDKEKALAMYQSLAAKSNSYSK